MRHETPLYCDLRGGPCQLGSSGIGCGQGGCDCPCGGGTRGKSGGGGLGGGDSASFAAFPLTAAEAVAQWPRTTAVALDVATRGARPRSYVSTSAEATGGRILPPLPDVERIREKLRRDLAALDRHRETQDANFGVWPIIGAIIGAVGTVAGIAQGEQARKSQESANKAALKQQAARNAAELEILAKQAGVAIAPQQLAQLQTALAPQGYQPQDTARIAAAAQADMAERARFNQTLLYAGLGLAAVLLVTR